MSVLPDSLAPKLANLFTLLGSDQEGEVLSATRAIQWTLASVGRDLHDLNAALDRPQPPPWIDYRERLPSPEHAAAVMVTEAHERIAWLLKEPDQISSREDEFLQSLRDQLRAGRPPSEKQAGWLLAIYRRCVVEEASS